MDTQIAFLKQFGVGLRNPKDEFFKEGTESCEALKSFGVVEVDDEDYLHRQFQTFSCHVPGCRLYFDTVLQYDQHYNSCHRFTCSQCNKNLPSSHLLDLHLMEVHDAFFQIQAEKKPMFQCYVEDCKDIFKNPQERRNHCITVHKFPSDFRFDHARKQKPQNKNPKAKPKSTAKKSTVEEENASMEVVEENQNASKPGGAKPKKKNQNSINTSRGRRKPILVNFCKDLKESLPEQ